MEKNIVLEDFINISDSKIRGVVMLQREDGTVLFTKENMIVEGGRTYLKNLVMSKLTGGTAEDRKIYSMKFGTGTNLTTSADEGLGSVIVDLTIDTTSLQWKKIDSGTKNSEGTVFPTGSIPEGYIFRNTSTDNLYQYVKAMEISELADSTIGLKINAIIRGTSANQNNISELGLFLDGTGEAMFSRLVFDPFPLTDGSAYILTYYIYF